MRRLFVVTVVAILTGCGSSDGVTTGSSTTQSPGSPSTDLSCTPGSETPGLDSSAVLVVVVSSPISQGTSVEEAIAANALEVREICASYAPLGAPASLESLDLAATAISDLEPNAVVTSQFG